MNCVLETRSRLIRPSTNCFLQRMYFYKLHHQLMFSAYCESPIGITNWFVQTHDTDWNGFKTFGWLKRAAFGNEIDCERTRLNPSHLRDKLKRKRETIRVNVNPHGHLFLSFIIYENQCQKRTCATLLRMRISLALSENYCYTTIKRCAYSCPLSRNRRTNLNERVSCIYII